MIKKRNGKVGVLGMEMSCSNTLVGGKYYTKNIIIESFTRPPLEKCLNNLPRLVRRTAFLTLLLCGAVNAAELIVGNTGIMGASITRFFRRWILQDLSPWYPDFNTLT
jgi:hypothetical protein